MCVFQQVEVSNLELSDDEELRDQMDMHNIIISCVNEEPLFTAEQVRLHTHKLNLHTNMISSKTILVSLTLFCSRTCPHLLYNMCFGQVIEEIEEIMQQSPDGEEHTNPSQFDLSAMAPELHKLAHSTSSSIYEDRKYCICVYYLFALHFSVSLYTHITISTLMFK